MILYKTVMIPMVWVDHIVMVIVYSIDSMKPVLLFVSI